MMTNEEHNDGRSADLLYRLRDQYHMMQGDGLGELLVTAKEAAAHIATLEAQLAATCQREADSCKRHDDKIATLEAQLAAADRLAEVEALTHQTIGGERQAHSRVGHLIREASWHVHLAGFRSRSDAEAALDVLVAYRAIRGGGNG